MSVLQARRYLLPLSEIREALTASVSIPAKSFIIMHLHKNQYESIGLGKVYRVGAEDRPNVAAPVSNTFLRATRSIVDVDYHKSELHFIWRHL
jgi:hypothetical protein